MDRLQALQLFARVVERGTISAAGRSLGLSKTVASKRLQDLEADLSIGLLNRTTRHVSVTEAGQALYDRIIPMIRDMDAIIEQISESTEAPSGVLRILARRSFGMLHIVPTLPSFRAEYPEVSVDLHLTETVEIAPSYGTDIAIRLGQPTEKSLDWQRLTTDRRMLCASPEYFRHHAPPADLSDLDRHNCLTYGQEAEPAVWVSEHLGKRRDIVVTGSLRSNSGEVLRQAALDGLGLALLPEWMIAWDVAAGRLQICFDDLRLYPAGYSAEIYAVYRRVSRLPGKLEAFLGHLQRHLGTHLN
ncbi:LysR family transcriptional regulator [Nisaea nitritireducens]|uniref:LysR family transcriptional regulator n=1 Tax=Nisaea nitritireducens TaxID=568392 RepID=UPI001866DE34|nr:LysR family transcriptional regulator [Nisaea nitritireducens]|tara:strand:+ start:1325 stop:2230 length:906 start_codon:yes stop_codon:yes gene_type:complete